jgi:hypothetical protein
MRSKLAITKLQAILLIDIIVVASAGAGLYYLQSYAQTPTLPPGVSPSPSPSPIPLSPAQIQLMGLNVNPFSVVSGQPVQVTVNVTNIGGQSGEINLELNLDGEPNQAQSVTLGAGETNTVNFTVSATTEGTHLIKVGGIESTFSVVRMFDFSDLGINRTQANINEPIGISLKVTNKANIIESYSLTLFINKAPVQTKTGETDAGATVNVLFEVTEQTEGNYDFEIAGLNGTFTIIAAAPPPKPASFQVNSLKISSTSITVGGAVTVTTKVTNVGEVSGSYTVDLKLNDAIRDTKTLQIAGGETVTVLFTLTLNQAGTYTIQVGDYVETVAVQDPGRIDLSNLAINPSEVWPGKPITISIKAKNPGGTVGTLPVTLKVDDVVIETKNVQVSPGTFLSVEFTFVAPALPGGDSMSHTVNVNGFWGGFKVVKTGFHSFGIVISPSGDADIILTLPSGEQEPHKTPYAALLPVGTYAVSVPLTDPTGKVTFKMWEDGSNSLNRTISLTDELTVCAYYSGGSSCPSLYMWNGIAYIYVTDVSNHGWLGYIDKINSDGSITYYRNNPWDYIPLDATQLQPTDGKFNLTLLQRFNEIFYLDNAYMLVVDHPANVSVASTMEEQYIDPNYMGKIYTLGNLQAPISAVNQNGQNVLPKISSVDGLFTNGTHGIQSPTWDNITWNRISLNFGNLTGAQQIKLVVRSIVDWGSPDDYTTWLNKFFENPIPDGTQVTPPPYMEVKDANGRWMRVPQSRDFTLPPDGSPRTYVIDLTGLFPTNDYSLRISNFWNVTFDYIGVDITPQQNLTIQRINPTAYLYKSVAAGDSAATGNFTSYGNVTELVGKQDDKFVIGRQGEAVDLQFPATNLAAPAPGMVRDYFLYEATWFKDETGNWGFGFGFTVDPLPFMNMTGFPYPTGEAYPNDTDHQDYLKQWNNRVIESPVTPQVTTSHNGFSNLPVVALPVTLLTISMVYINFKFGAFDFLYSKRQKRI